MSSLSAQLRRARPSQVQTGLYSQQTPTVPTSAISASSVASSSRQSSPIMSPDTAVLTTNSSVQVSPDAMRPKDEDQYPTTFQLPESILIRKTSSNSIGPGRMATTSPIAESTATFSTTAPSTSTLANSSKGNLIRRLSSRASRSINRRRQSSAAPTSRDGSIGPCFLRRRSDSNTTAPPEFASVNTDSESDIDDKDEFTGFRTIFYLDGALRDSSSNSVAGSVNGSSNTMDGPVTPPRLQQGTWVKKVTKNRLKRVRLVYEPDANKLIWDKSRPHKFLHVDEVREVRFGSDVHQYTRDYKMGEVERTKWFSILYSIPEKSKSKLIHLIADDVATRDAWISFLDAMLKHRQDVMTSLMSFNDKAVAQFWQSEMSKQFGDRPRTEQQEEMDIAGVMRVCQNLHIYSSQSTLQANFHLSDSRRRERVNFAEFLDFLGRMRQRRDVQRIIRSIAAKPELGITMTEFLSFLRDIQGEDVEANRSLWEKYFVGFVRKYPKQSDTEKPESLVSDTMFMSENAFAGYLASSHNMPLSEEPQEYTLDRPMNEYFISSSHNTYLLGRQVAGQSSIEGYINALVRGCRCVEVDCWDGSDGQPQVVHGRTLTSAISFREVMKTINKYAFVRSRFPLWISLEVHCNPTQQAIMTQIIKECFGARLVTEPLDPELDKLPSPSELMERILIKVKKPQGRDESTASDLTGRRRGSSLSSPMSRPTIPDGNPLIASQSVPQSPLLSASVPTRKLVGKNRVDTITEGEVQELMSSSASDAESSCDNVPVRKSANKTVKILGDLGVYCAGVKFAGFDAPDAKKFNHIFSFMESSFAKHCRTKEEKMALDIHNMRYMMRVYPDGMRLGSSNFDPLIYWRRGVQMNALNWQTFDLGMQLNHAMFEGGKDASGYVLKPTELRDIQVLPFNSAIAEGKKERSVVSFSIDIVSAQQLMRPASLAANRSMDPYIEVEVFHANDKRDKKELKSNLAHEPDSALKVQTEIIRENGFNPLFTNGQFKFKVTTKHPELIFVRWSVRLSTDGESYNNKDRPAIATYMAKLMNLKQGYRTLPLLNHAGDQYLFSTLFCKIKVDSVEKTLVDSPQPVTDRSKLNRLGGKVFGRGNTSPRNTLERSSIDKGSFESSS